MNGVQTCAITISFTFNAFEVAKKWEKGAPEVKRRIEAAKKVFDAGYQTRIRIDPMVPIENWELHYKELIDEVFNAFMPERITIGSLRGLQSTINAAKDKTGLRTLEKNRIGVKKFQLKLALKCTHPLLIISMIITITKI